MSLVLGKKGDRSGSGLALVILVAPSPETALVGGKQGQEAGQEHSEWAELGWAQAPEAGMLTLTMQCEPP